jgi:hypothetical protein
MLGGVGNDFHPASADIIYTRHDRKGIRIFPGANVNDEPGEAGVRYSANWRRRSHRFSASSIRLLPSHKNQIGFALNCE